MLTNRYSVHFHPGCPWESDYNLSEFSNTFKQFWLIKGKDQHNFPFTFLIARSSFKSVYVAMQMLVKQLFCLEKSNLNVMESRSEFDSFFFTFHFILLDFINSYVILHSYVSSYETDFFKCLNVKYVCYLLCFLSPQKLIFLFHFLENKFVY